MQPMLAVWIKERHADIRGAQCVERAGDPRSM
jgi:hypothetical protein